MSLVRFLSVSLSAADQGWFKSRTAWAHHRAYTSLSASQKELGIDVGSRVSPHSARAKPRGISSILFRYLKRTAFGRYGTLLFPTIGNLTHSRRPIRAENPDLRGAECAALQEADEYPIPFRLKPTL